MNDEYLSIAEFAKQAGVTKQAIYLRLNKDLKPYLKELESKKYLKIEALELFGVKPLEQALETKYSSTLIDLADHLQRQYEQLQEQNKRFDRLIDTLENELEIKNSQIRELSSNLSDNMVLLDQQQKLNAHALLASSASSDKAAADKYKMQFQNQMKDIAKILYRKYPEAAEYLIREFEKKQL